MHSPVHSRELAEFTEINRGKLDHKRPSMSNRRRLAPPDSVVRYARAYRCADCTSDVGRVSRDPLGIWHVEVKHDVTCPVLTGTVNPFGDVLAAVVRTAASGLGVVYVGGPP